MGFPRFERADLGLIFATVMFSSEGSAARTVMTFDQWGQWTSSSSRVAILRDELKQFQPWYRLHERMHNDGEDGYEAEPVREYCTILCLGAETELSWTVKDSTDGKEKARERAARWGVSPSDVIT